jgi:hypothetical protein
MELWLLTGVWVCSSSSRGREKGLVSSGRRRGVEPCVRGGGECSRIVASIWLSFHRVC